MDNKKLRFAFYGSIVASVFLIIVFISMERGYNEIINTLSLVKEEDISEIWVSSELWTENLGKEKNIIFKEKTDITDFLKAVDDIERFKWGKPLRKIETWPVRIRIKPLKITMLCHIRENNTTYLYCYLMLEKKETIRNYGTFRSEKIRSWIENLEIKEKL
jgi:hypothetical protein